MTTTEDSAPRVDVATASVAVLGGTGDQGRGLARRLALAGNTVYLGSRRIERAQQAAAELVEGESSAIDVRGLDNTSAAAEGDIVIVAVPWDGHRELLQGLVEPLAGKIVVDCVNPLGFDKRGPFPLEAEEGSAAQQAEQILVDSRVTAAFHHVSARLLLDPDVEEVELDVLVMGEDRAATDTVRELADRIPGVRGVFGGRLRNAHQVEALTANIIAVNRRYKTHAGIRITGL